MMRVKQFLMVALFVFSLAVPVLPTDDNQMETNAIASRCGSSCA